MPAIPPTVALDLGLIFRLACFLNELHYHHDRASANGTDNFSGCTLSGKFYVSLYY